MAVWDLRERFPQVDGSGVSTRKRCHPRVEHDSVWGVVLLCEQHRWWMKIQGLTVRQIAREENKHLDHVARVARHARKP